MYIIKLTPRKRNRAGQEEYYLIRMKTKKFPPPRKTQGRGSLSSSSCPLLLPAVPGLPAPHFHPANSCLRRWLGSGGGGGGRPCLLLVVVSSQRWGCCRGVSSSLPFVVPLSTLRAGARSGGVGVGCRLVFCQLGELQCGRGSLPRGYPTSLGSLIPPM